MLNWIAANWVSLVVDLVVLGVGALSVFATIRNKKKNKGDCDCGCEGCPSASLCHKRQ